MWKEKGFTTIYAKEIKILDFGREEEASEKELAAEEEEQKKE